MTSSSAPTSVPTSTPSEPTKEAPPPPPAKKKQILCERCKKPFPSKNALFRHLKSQSSSSPCLTREEHIQFMNQVVNSREENYEKVAILYGYICSHSHLQLQQMIQRPEQEQVDEKLEVETAETTEALVGVKGGDHAAQLLYEAAREVSLGEMAAAGTPTSNSHDNSNVNRVNRSYGCQSRSPDIQEQLAQDECTGALSEIACLRLPALFWENEDDYDNKNENEVIAMKAHKQQKVVQKWVDDVNKVLERKVQQPMMVNNGSSYYGGKVKVFGRLTVPKKFNAEVDVTHRRIDYLLPADLLYGPKIRTIFQSPDASAATSATNADDKSLSLNEFCDLLTSFNRGQTIEQSNTRGLLTYLHKLKRLMQSLCTQIVELDPNANANAKAKEVEHDNNCCNDNDDDSAMKTKKKKKHKSGETAADSSDRVHVGSKDGAKDEKLEESKTTNELNNTKKIGKDLYALKRRRFHNFTPKMMAHEFLAYRRLDRMYHRATVRPNELTNSSNFDIGLQSIGSRPFVALSLKGDLFLNGQSRAIIGLFVAIVLGYIDEDIVECIFDEDYSSLVPAPVAPSFGQYAAEAWYISWEGKMKAILCPRECHTYLNGFNRVEILKELSEFQDEMYCNIMRSWNLCDNDGNVPNANSSRRLGTCEKWMTDYLEPWSQKAKQQLVEYRKWKKARDTVEQSNSTSMTVAAKLLPPLESISSDVPKLYEKVLFYLREINSSNTWPTTTPKRQLVMVSSDNDKRYEQTSLAVSHMRTQSLKTERQSAYSFREGEGGASGSFSVGAMPGGGQCEEPKGNRLFPELMKAAFELEIALRPDREPSSTIAINRNAQFRPHLDNGAGAGQSRSLIVGLGTYVGGELMVEGKQHCIRYKPLEFNGWTERHWTKEFVGERYSLVWFTPKGCEGVRGIDLCAQG